MIRLLIQRTRFITLPLREYALIALLSVGMPALGDATLPSIGNESSDLISLAQEKKLGEAWLRSLRRQVKTYDNPIVEEYLANLVYSLAPNSNVQDRDFRLVIIDSPALNAFAVPGSIIGVNAGLFFHAVTEQEFASVMAHELAHLGQRHYARRLEQQKISTPLTLAGVLASVVIAATAGSDAGVAALASTQALGADKQLQFSRQNEQEADRIGLVTLYESQYDPRAMPMMFERMYRQSRSQNNSFPEYLSTHPLSETRISDTLNRVSQYERKNYRDNIQYHFSKSIVVTDYAETETSAQQYFSSIIDKGTSGQIQAARFGLAYALRNTNPEQAIEVLRGLATELPGQLPIQTLLAQALHNNKQSDEAISLLQKQLERNPANYPISMTLAKIFLAQNKLEESRKLLKLLSRQKPQQPQVWYLLAEVNGLAGEIVELHQARAEYFLLHGRLDEALEQLKLAKQKAKSSLTGSAIQKRTDELQTIKNNPAF